MGISVNFRGVIKEENKFSLLMEELIDICQISGWDYNLVGIEKDSEKTPPLKGIIFTVGKKCDSFPVLLNPEGTLKSLETLNYYDPTNPDQDIISIKTQFSTPDIHIKIIKLLTYLEKKYFDHFEITDEGGYWDNRDESTLKEVFKTPETINQGQNRHSVENPLPSNPLRLQEEYIEKTLGQTLFPEPDQEE